MTKCNVSVNVFLNSELNRLKIKCVKATSEFRHNNNTVQYEKITFNLRLAKAYI